MTKHLIDHTFVVLAYKKSPFLETCIQSLLDQTAKSRIILSTSTPSIYIENMAGKYNIDLFVNPKKGGISQDWTFAYAKADTAYVTLAHQDDIYTPDYAKRCLKVAGQCPDNLIVFTDYGEIVNNSRQNNRGLVNVKRGMLFPFFRFKKYLNSCFLKTRLLSLGNPICCPSVMYHKAKIGDFSFSKQYSMNLDWDALRRLSQRQGAFVYVNDRLIYRRIHAGSESTNALGDQRRHHEDRMMFACFWPRPIVDLILKIYSQSYKYN